MTAIDEILQKAEIIGKEPGKPQSQKDINKLKIAMRYAINQAQRWIPVSDKLPENYTDLILSKFKTKEVLVKRKWLDNGEITKELNNRFCPSQRIGFVWNYDYEKSEIIEWRPIEIK